MGSEGESKNALDRLYSKVFQLIDGPCTWFKETIVLPNQQHYPYYHRKYPRVPTIDECYEGESTCMFEAHEQFRRDMAVDGRIVTILKSRKVDCVRYEGYEADEKCAEIFKQAEEALLNYFIKYGDLGAYFHVKDAYMKQKHRMIYERRKAAGTWNPELK